MTYFQAELNKKEIISAIIDRVDSLALLISCWVLHKPDKGPDFQTYLDS